MNEQTDQPAAEPAQEPVRDYAKEKARWMANTNWGGLGSDASTYRTWIMIGRRPVVIEGNTQ